MFLVRSKHAKAPHITADLHIDGCLINMEVDTEASTSVCLKPSLEGGA